MTGRAARSTVVQMDRYERRHAAGNGATGSAIPIEPRR